MNTSVEILVLERILTPLTRCLTPEVAQALLDLRVDAETQAQIDELADKCTEGELSAEERAEYAAYVAAINLVSLMQAKARAWLRDHSDAA
jgi:hypothetical protein